MGIFVVGVHTGKNFKNIGAKNAGILDTKREKNMR